MSTRVEQIPFNRPYVTGDEFGYIEEAIANGHLSGNGPFAERCAEWLEDQLGVVKALLVPSCTAGLEMAAILAELQPGDEVIMPSFTFPSTASAVVLRGAVPVFVEIREDTLNLDEAHADRAVTPRTRAIFAVHYAGVACEMDALGAVAASHGLLLVEDAAQGLLATYKGRPLGSIGEVAAVSFHETKNAICGEGGALLLNDHRLSERAEILQEKGTNRHQFFRGEVDKYSWVDVGSSWTLSELNAAFLYAQLQEAVAITQRRLDIWSAYHEAFADAEAAGRIRRPIVPSECRHNAHMYYLLLEDERCRAAFIESLRSRGVHAIFHYIPLHTAAAGRRYGRAAGSLALTEELSERVVRLPLWPGMGEGDVGRVIEAAEEALRQLPGSRH